MKIGILTHQLSTNYGGLLQNFALQVLLRDLGHNPITLDYYTQEPLKMKILSFGSRLLRKMRGEVVPLRGWPTEKEKAIMAQYTSEFVKENITTTDKFLLLNIGKFQKDDFDAIVVGSDQVWRKREIVKHFFLSDFDRFPIRKIAYAASFGITDWLFTQDETKEFSRLVRQFNAVSVREQSGVGLCKNYLGVNSECVLDPTLMIEPKHYESVVEKKGIPHLTNNSMMVYILDKSSEKQKIVDYVSEQLGLSQYSVMAEHYFHDPGERDIFNCVFPPVESWLRGFIDAEFVVTDSFHGMVFSIIFNKPFIAIMNKKRGSDRFVSLLSTLGLEHRLVYSYEEAMETLNSDIDYVAVNQKLQIERTKSKRFLEINLKQ